MKKLFVLLVALSLFGISRAQNSHYTLYLYTAEYSGPCIKFTKDLSNNSKMKSTLENYNLVEVNVETPPKDGSEAHTYFVFSKREYPLFVVVDNNSNIVKIQHGYVSSERFIEEFDPSLFGEELYMTAEDFSKNVENRKERVSNMQKSFMYKLTYVYKWKFLGITAAANLSNLSDDSKYKFGYQFGLPVYRGLSYSWKFDTGLFFNSIGAKDMRLNYIMIPAEFGKTLFLLSSCGNSMNLSAGAYGAYRVGGMSVEGSTLANFDAGLRAKLYAEMGSFKFWFGYQRGIIKVVSGSKAYNNVFTIGANVYLGR